MLDRQRNSFCSASLSDLSPKRRINGQRDTPGAGNIDETAVMRDLAIAEQTREKRQSVLGQTAIDVRLLFV